MPKSGSGPGSGLGFRLWTSPTTKTGVRARIRAGIKALELTYDKIRVKAGIRALHLTYDKRAGIRALNFTFDKNRGRGQDQGIWTSPKTR